MSKKQYKYSEKLCAENVFKLLTWRAGCEAT